MRFGGRAEQQKASVHRKLDADRLREAQRWRGAMYLLGYAIECSLKARLMEKYRVFHLCQLEQKLSQSKRTRGKLKKLVDTKTHDLVELMGWTGSEHLMEQKTKQMWGRVCKWSVDWRYNPDEAGLKQCKEFFDAGAAVLGFINAHV